LCSFVFQFVGFSLGVLAVGLIVIGFVTDFLFFFVWIMGSLELEED
jgi:hypothetical protein